MALDTTTLPLPTSSSSDAIQTFIKSLTDASQGRHRLIKETQAAFDDALQAMRGDVEHHMTFSDKHSFQCKTYVTLLKSIPDCLFIRQLGTPLPSRSTLKVAVPMPYLNTPQDYENYWMSCIVGQMRKQVNWI